MLLDNSDWGKDKGIGVKVFLKKGYKGNSCTRDIEGGQVSTFALLNYYFRTEKSCFELICETMFSFTEKMAVVLNDEDSKLEKKVELIAWNYMWLFSLNWGA